MVFPLYYNVKIEGRMYWLPSIKWKSINKLENARIVIKNACLVSVYSPEEDAPLWAPPDTCRKKKPSDRVFYNFGPKYLSGGTGACRWKGSPGDPQRSRLFSAMRANEALYAGEQRRLCWGAGFAQLLPLRAFSVPWNTHWPSAHFSESKHTNTHTHTLRNAWTFLDNGMSVYRGS